jgi:hypothetical protein
MLQFLGGGGDLLLNMLQILMLPFEPLQLCSKSIPVCGTRLCGLAQAPNLSLPVSL